MATEAKVGGTPPAKGSPQSAKAAARTLAPDSFLAQFIAGACTPSLRAILIAVVTAVSLFAYCAWRVTPELVAKYPGHFTSFAKDETANLSAKAWKIAMDPPKTQSVVIIGDSSIRESVSSAAELEAALTQKLGRPINVRLLACGGLTQWGSVAITDLIRPHIKGLVLVEISTYDLAHPKTSLNDPSTNIKFAFDSEALREEYRLAGIAPSPRFGNYFLDNYKFFFARPGVVLSPIRGPYAMPQHFVDEADPWTEADYAANADRINLWQIGYDANVRHNMGVYQRMLGRLRSTPGVDMVLYEFVQNPRNLIRYKDRPNYGALRERFETDVHRFSTENNVKLLDVVADAKLTDSDFIDYAHVADAGARKRVTAALADRLAPMLERVAAGQLAAKPDDRKSPPGPEADIRDPNGANR